MADLNFDDLLSDNFMTCLTGGDESSIVQPSSSLAVEDYGPRSKGGFAANGKATPLTFADLRVGMIVVRHSVTSSLPEPTQSNVSKDLSAVLRPKENAQQLVPQSSQTSTNADTKSQIQDNFISDSATAATGLSDEHMQQLRDNMFVIVGLNRTEKTVVAEYANRKQLVIQHFGTYSKTAAESPSYYRAGQVEETLFARWRESPDQLAAVGTKRTRDDEPPLTYEGLLAPKTATENWWWIVKGLLVRYVPRDETKPNFGCKGTVVECSRKDDRVTLKCNRSPQEEGGAAFVMIKCCQADLETVVPRAGERGMVLRPSLAGELVTVLSKTKDKVTGDPVLTVEVENQTLTLKAEEICVLS